MFEYGEIKNKIYQKIGEDLGGTEEIFYVSIGENQVYELSPAVYYVWTKLDGKTTVESLIKNASVELEIEEEKIREPIVTIIHKLKEENLITEQKQ